MNPVVFDAVMNADPTLHALAGAFILLIFLVAGIVHAYEWIRDRLNTWRETRGDANGTDGTHT